ncbi:MAG: S8 family peptidase [Candidatus Heimdallarchaeaceae archaeon]
MYEKRDGFWNSRTNEVALENYSFELKSDTLYSNYVGFTAILGDFLDWGVDDINAEHIWGNAEDATDIDDENVYTGNGIVIAVIDTGISKTSGNVHTEFTGKIVDEISILNQVIGSDASDGYGHGTHCAGVISARDNDGGIIGVAPESELLIAKALTNSGYILDMDDIADAIKWAVDEGADIISMSIRTGGDYEAIHDEIIAAYQAGVVLVAAAGNENDDELEYPARYYEVISVGAIDDEHERSLWPNGKGSNYDALLDVVAPGTDIYSTWTNNGYATISGTSMATPHVAGLCALMLEAQSILTPTQVRDILRITATDLGDVGKDDEFGYGEIQAVKAVDAAELYFTDTDGDDITDAYEKYVYDTDPNDSDSDNDGLTDGYEVNTSLTDPNDSDCDDDGLFDGQEINTYSTDPWDSDSDNDGCPDKWEVDNNFNPNVANGALDLDDDDLRNIDEYYIGTDPNDDDTDGDNIIDGDEVYWNLDPLDDSDADDDNDSDGYTNEEEINGIYDPQLGETFYTNPNEEDTDGDGWDDYQELNPRRVPDTDPTDPNDHPPTWP